MSSFVVQNKLVTLAVIFDGTVIHPQPSEPKTRADAYITIRPQFVHSPEDLVDAVLTCEPLVRHFRERGQLCALELAQKVSNSRLSRVLTIGASLSPTERLVLHALRSDELHGWQNWIEFSGDGQLEVFKSMVRKWLEGAIDPSEDQTMVRSQWSRQLALLHFENLPVRTLSALGVVLVEADQAEGINRTALLRKSVPDANEVAQQLGLAIRFARHSNRMPWATAAENLAHEVTP